MNIELKEQQLYERPILVGHFNDSNLVYDYIWTYVPAKVGRFYQGLRDSGYEGMSYWYSMTEEIYGYEIRLHAPGSHTFAIAELDKNGDGLKWFISNEIEWIQVSRKWWRKWIARYISRGW